MVEVTATEAVGAVHEGSQPTGRGRTSRPGRPARSSGLARHLAKRVVSALVLLLIVSALSFLLISLSPGDPARQIVGVEATEETYQATRQQLGLDEPVVTQYLTWLRGAVTGDLGTSIYTGEEVTSMLLHVRFGVTASLVLLALLVSLVMGVSLGFLGAVRGGLTARVLDGIAMLGFAVPSFWLGAVLASYFAVQAGLLPATGYVSFGESPGDWLRCLILPVIALSIHAVAAIAKQTRDVVEEILGSEAIRMAYANGISRRTLLMRHAMKNAGIRVITVMSVQAIGLMGGTVMIEAVFSMPGLGSLAVEASHRGDLPTIQGVVVLFTVLVVLINLLSDTAYSLLNPKVVTR